MKKYLTAAALILCAGLLFPAAAADVAEGETLQENPAGSVLTINDGTVQNNPGSIQINHSLVVSSSGYLYENRGSVVSSSGTVEYNYGKIFQNYGQLNRSFGTVGTNAGPIILNTGIVESNSAYISTNAMSGVVTQAGGSIRENRGTEIRSDGSTWYGLEIIGIQGGNDSELKQIPAGEPFSLKQFPRWGYDIVGYTDMNRVYHEGTEYDGEGPNILTLRWRKAAVTPEQGGHDFTPEASQLVNAADPTVIAPGTTEDLKIAVTDAGGNALEIREWHLNCLEELPTEKNPTMLVKNYVSIPYGGIAVVPGTITFCGSFLSQLEAGDYMLTIVSSMGTRYFAFSVKA